MYLIARCPRCSYRWWLDADATDRRVRCRKCRVLLRIPHSREFSDAAGIAAEAGSELYVDMSGRLYG